MYRTNRHRPLEEQIDIYPVGLENAHRWIVLKGAPKPGILKYWHEDAKAWLYVALHSYADEWINEFPLGEGALVSDITMTYQGKVFHLEVDLGNMEPQRLFYKIERYTQYAGSGDRVIFVLGDGKYKAGVIGTSIIDYCNGRMVGDRPTPIGDFITATLLENFLKFPLGDVLISPKGGRISITQLG
jgi:hypothetical protein